VKLLEFATPAVILSRRPRLFCSLPEVASLPDYLNSERFHKLHGLGEFNPGVDEKRFCDSGFPCEDEGRHTILSPGEGDVDAGAVMHMLSYGADRIPFEVLQVIPVLPDGNTPFGVGRCPWGHGNDLFHPDESLFYHSGPEPLFIRDNDGPVLHGYFEGKTFPPDSSWLHTDIGISAEIDDTPGGMRDQVRECFRGDIQAEPAAHRVKRQPAKPVTVHDHKVGPVESSGLVQENNVWQWNGAELFVNDFFDQLPVGSQRRAYIIRL
jgi:hypothetical protein